jgi:peroxiredoxin
MARTPSTMSPLGTTCPDFDLPDPRGTRVTRDEAMGEHGLLVMFICNHCPFVIHIAEAMADIGRTYPPRGLNVVAISSNDVPNYPADSPEKMVEECALRGYEFPYLYDESQQVARSFDAACTPDFFLYDDDGMLVYRGQLDASRPGSDEPVTGADLRAAMDAVIAGEPVSTEQVPSLGCNIKWKAG